MRAPFDDGCSPSPASITPARMSSSLNLPISRRSSLLGITPASLSLLAFTRTMNRIVVLLPCGAAIIAASVHASNETGPDRHDPRKKDRVLPTPWTCALLAGPHAHLGEREVVPARALGDPEHLDLDRVGGRGR